MSHRTHIRLHCAAGHGPHGTIDTVDTAMNTCHVAGHCHAGGIVGMHPERHTGWHDFLQANGRIVNGLRVGGAARVFEAN